MKETNCSRLVRDRIPEIIDQVDESVWKKLTREEKREIERVCDERLEDYCRGGLRRNPDP